MRNQVENKVVVIAGSAGLLGNEFVRLCNERGAIVIEADIKNELSGHRYPLDITNEESIASLISDVTLKHGRIDAWVNTAYPRTADWGLKLEDIPFDSWRRNIDMHLNGYFLCSQLVLRLMMEQGHGSIIQIASIYGVVGPDFSIYNGTEMTMPAAYSAIKGGLVNMTRYMAAYGGPRGVRVNTLSPGGILDGQPASFQAAYNAKLPLGRMGVPRDISGVLAFLISDDASYITGQNIIVDGGWTAI